MNFKARVLSRLLILTMILNLFCFMESGMTVFASDALLYEPQNVLAIDGATSGEDNEAMLLISWRNPQATTLEKVSLFDLSGTCIYENSTPVSGEAEEFSVGNLNRGSYYTYKLVYKFSDRKDTEVFTSGMANSRYYDRILKNSPRIYTTSATGGNPAPYSQKIIIDGTDKYVNLNSNIKNGAERQVVSFDMAFATVKEKTYKLSVEYRSETALELDAVVTPLSLSIGKLVLPATNTWKTVDLEFTAPKNRDDYQRIVLKTSKSFTNFDIKSVNLENVTDSVASEYLYDCSIYDKLPEAPKKVTYVPNGTSLNIDIDVSDSWNWSDGTDGAAHTAVYYNIYEVIDGTDVLRAKIVRSGNGVKKVSTTLNNLESGSFYTYKVTCSDAVGLESAAVEQTVEMPNPYNASNFKAEQYRISAYQVGMEISWTNPSADSLTGVKLYRTDGGNDTLLCEYNNATSGEFVTFKDTNLDTGKIYYYKVVSSFSDKADAYKEVNSKIDLTVEELVPSYNPKNLTATQYGSGSGKMGITISWVNPCVLTLKDITVSRLEADGSETILSSDFDLAPEKVVEYSDLTVESGSHTYKITFSYTDALSREYYRTAAVGDGTFAHYIRGVNIISIQSKSKIVPGITNRVVNDGNNSYLKLTCNVPEGDSERGAYMQFSSQESLLAENTYKFNFKYKTEDDISAVLKSGDINQKGTTLLLEKSSGWTTVSVDLVPPYKARNIFLDFGGNVSSLLIDDISITNGGATVDYFNFDEYDKTPEAPGSFEASAMNNSVTLNMAVSNSWWWSADSASDAYARTILVYNVYEKTNEGLDLRMTLRRDAIGTTALSGVLSNLMYNSEYAFVATCEDGTGVLESPGIEAKTRTEKEPTGIQISDYRLVGAVQNEDQSIAPGTFDVKVDIANYDTAALNAQLIAAVYSNNKMVAAYGTPVTAVNSSIGNKPTAELKINNVTVPGGLGEDCTLEILLWSGIDSMRILKSAKVFEIK